MTGNYVPDEDIDPAAFMFAGDYWKARGIREMLFPGAGPCEGVDGEHAPDCDERIDRAVVEVRGYLGAWSQVSTYCLFAHDEALYALWAKEMQP